MIGIQICITPTDEFVEVEGAPCRIWRGRTTLGVECLVFVRGIGVPDENTDSTEFDACLESTGSLAVAIPIAHPGRGGRRDEEEDDT